MATTTLPKARRKPLRTTGDVRAESEVRATLVHAQIIAAISEASSPLPTPRNATRRRPYVPRRLTWGAPKIGGSGPGGRLTSSALWSTLKVMGVWPA